MLEKQIRVAIIEDDDTFRENMTYILERTSIIKIVGKYKNGKKGIKGILRSIPDITLLDLGLPDIHGVDVIKTVLGKGYATEFIVFSAYDDDEHLFSALKAGAIGYMVKNESDLSDITEAISGAVRGGAPMSLGIARRVLEEFKDNNIRDGKFEQLTQRENEILGYISKGFITRKVAKVLNISYETVRCHQKSIYMKLRVSSMVEAAAVYRGMSVRTRDLN